ncbi:hypothetical protein B0H19DRAFT_1152967 [Mycena capillaripes]|nr:hypothetical protein B0H19DRAFT_1152967 [Mycena capillaripes]
MFQKMMHEPRLIGNLPVDTITSDVFNRLVNGLDNPLKPSWAVLDHAKDKHVAGTTFTFTFNLQLVRVPRLGPLQRIRVDTTQE